MRTDPRDLARRYPATVVVVALMVGYFVLIAVLRSIA